MYIDIPFIPGILIILVISILLARFWRTISSFIGEPIRKLLINLWQIIKKKYNQYKT